MICRYCGRPAKLASGYEVYPHRVDLHSKKFWVCFVCDARVGCHEGTTRPLGELANSELRDYRMRAHDEFDYIWKSGYMSRGQAYRWLASKLRIPREKCHIGKFDV